jgi:hypothetical protein
MESQEAGFPHSLEIPLGFPHSHGIVCTAACTILVGDIVSCEQACRASGCLNKVASSGFFA